jgi:hypothetical protein
VTVFGALFGIPVPAWYEDAVCAQTRPDAFFPEVGESTADAKAVCLECPVRVQCLQYALDRDERFGVWGGFSERERRRLKRGERVPLGGNRKQAAPVVCAVCRKEFYGNSHTAKYCTKRCANRALYERQQARRAAKDREAA